MVSVSSIGKQFFFKGLHSSLFSAAASLECHSCENFWTKGDIEHLMSSPHVGGWVLTKHMMPVSYIVFEHDVQNKLIHLLNLVVHTDFRRQKIGTDFINRLISEYCNKCDAITVDVRESNLTAHLFLKNNGFVATDVRSEFFKDVYEDRTETEAAYSFRKGFHV